MKEEEISLVRRIASVVGHELRNPLAVINNSAYFLKTKLGADGRLDPKVEKHLGIVTSEISRVDRMISDILAFSRPLELKPSALPVNPLIEAELAALALPDGVKVKKALAKGGPEALIDEDRFRDALRRLLDNAAEAMPQGGTITASSAQRDDCVLIVLRDTGPGLKPEARASLFSPFCTTKPRGLGLGLAMAKKIIEAHGGAIEAESSSSGAAFTLRLPKAR